MRSGPGGWYDKDKEAYRYMSFGGILDTVLRDLSSAMLRTLFR